MRIGTGLLVVLCLCSSPAVLQDMRTAAADNLAPRAAAKTGPNECRGMDAKLAHERADLAFRRAQYQQAGQCYLIAGDKPRADLAFVKAGAAGVADTTRPKAGDGTQVLVQLQQFREALDIH